MIYGMNAVLKTGMSSDSCAIMFLGEDRQEIVLVSEPIRYASLSIPMYISSSSVNVWLTFNFVSSHTGVLEELQHYQTHP